MMNDLLVKLLAREASAEEISLAEEWINASEENGAYFSHFKLIWNGTEAASAKSTISEDAAWERFSQLIKAQKPEPIIRNINYWIKIAAIFITACTAGFFGYRQYQNSRPAYMVRLHSMDKVMADTLSDGSVITLNKNSSIAHLNKFKGNNRKVSLKGEAFFKVEPDKTKPFIITVNNVTVTVLGTSFNIKSRNGKTDVVVETGVVRVQNNQDAVELRAGEKAEVSEADGKLIKENSASKLYNYYRSKEFVCDHTPLSELVAVLNEAYQADIRIANPALRNLPLTAVFKDQPAEHILAVIAKTFNIRVEKAGSQYILK